MSQLPIATPASIPFLESRQFHSFYQQMTDTEVRIATEEALLSEQCSELIKDENRVWAAIHILCLAAASHPSDLTEQEDRNIRALLDRVFPLGAFQGSRLGRQVDKVRRSILGQPTWNALGSYALAAGFARTVEASFERGDLEGTFQDTVDHGNFEDLNCLKRSDKVWEAWKEYLAPLIRPLYDQLGRSTAAREPMRFRQLLSEAPLVLRTFAQTATDQGFKGWTLIHKIVAEEQLELARIVNEQAPNGFRGANLIQDRQGRTPLHLAVDNENTEMIQILLDSLGKHTAQVLNRQDQDGNTPLHELAYFPRRQNLNSFLALGPELLECALLKKNHEGDTPIHLLMRHGSIECLQALLDTCGEVMERALCVKNAEGETPWHTLLRRSDLAAFQVVAKVHWRSLRRLSSQLFSRDDTLLHFAVRHSNPCLIEALAKSLGGELDNLMVQQNSRGSTPAHVAARLGFLEKMETLRALAPEPFFSSLNRQDEGGRLAVHWVAIWEECSILDQVGKSIGGDLMCRLVDEDEFGTGKFSFRGWALAEATATYQQRLGKKRSLLKSLDKRAVKQVSLDMIHQRSRKMAECLLGQDSQQSVALLAMGDKSGVTALELAMRRGSTPLFSQMIQSVGDHCPTLLSLPSSERSLMLVLVRRGSLQQLEALSQFQPMAFGKALLEANGVGRSLLHDLVARADLDCAPLLDGLLQGSDGLPVDNRGRTPFHEVCEKGNPEVTKILFSRVQDNGLDYEGKSPLHLAVWNSDVATLRELLTLAPKVCSHWLTLPDSQGMTPVYHAIEANDSEALRVLLLHDLQACQEALKMGLARDSSYTPLHLIAAHNKIEAFTVLSQFTEDACREILTRRVPPRKSPVDIALYQGHSEIHRRFLKLIKETFGR